MKKIDRTGEKHTTKEGDVISITEYFTAHNSTIMFENGCIKHNVYYKHIKRGDIKNPFRKDKYGIGYIGSGEYKAKEKGISLRVHNVWRDIIRRCYNEKRQVTHPTYIGCSICLEWQNFQNFAKWFEENYIPDYDLDKDLLIKGNKIYSPDTCCFIPHEINLLLVKRNAKRGKYLIGVHKDKEYFVASYGLSGGVKCIGRYLSELDAFNAYKKSKETHIKEIAEKWKNKISVKVHQTLINYQVDITD
jgi:hypothetical protein